LDAFEKLLKLNLKGKQDRDIVVVLIHCCLQEKTYNKFYGHLGDKLCSFQKDFKTTFQFAFWDRIKTLSTMDPRAISNLALLMAELIVRDALNLMVLRIVDFSNLDAKNILFFRLLFQTMLGNCLMNFNEFEMKFFSVVVLFYRC